MKTNPSITKILPSSQETLERVVNLLKLVITQKLLFWPFGILGWSCALWERRWCVMTNEEMKCVRNLFIFFSSLEFSLNGAKLDILLGPTCPFIGAYLIWLLGRLLFLSSTFYVTYSVLSRTSPMVDLTSWLFLHHGKFVLVEVHLLTCYWQPVWGKLAAQHHGYCTI